MQAFARAGRDPGEAVRHRTSATVRAKLMVNTPGDAYEQEADRIADRVMRTAVRPASAGGRPHAPCACGGGCPRCRAEGAVARASAAHGSEAGGFAAPPIMSDVLGAPGRPLERGTRTEMERHLGHDLGGVRVHTDERAAESAARIGARAYTVGSDVVFGAGQYAPDARAGRRLLAHELVHVVQQSGAGVPRVQRAPGGTEEEAEPQAEPWNPPSGCASGFCKPFSSREVAIFNQTDWSWMRLVIGAVISPRVVPVWDMWKDGGTSTVQDFTADFGADFAASEVTEETTEILVSGIKHALAQKAPVIPPGETREIDIADLVPSTIRGIDTPGSTVEMNFAGVGDIPGNLAGGVGKDQGANQIGANPSTQEDARLVKGKVTVLNSAAGGIVGIPQIEYTVKDTVDLCPGNCGAIAEQIATVPMSRWEATGISGDVPFTVDFSPFVAPFSIMPFAPDAEEPETKTR